MYLRRELVIISNKLSSDTLNANLKEQNAENIIEDTEKSLFQLAEKGTFSQSFLNLIKLLIKQFKWPLWQCKAIKV